MVLHLLPGDGLREWPAQGVAAPRTAKEKAALDLLYRNVPPVPSTPQQRATISDVDQRQVQAREFANRPRHVLRYTPHSDGRPGGRIEPIPAQPQRSTTNHREHAWHESGHCIVARALGLTVDSIDIIQNGRAGGQCVIPDLHRAPLLDQITVLRAGVVACRIAGHPYHDGGQGGDFVEIQRLLTAAGVTLGDDFNAMVARADRRAEDIIRKNWAEAERLVAELVAKRKLTFVKPTTAVRKASIPMMVRSATMNASADDTVSMVFTTGAAVRRTAFDGPYDEVLLTGPSNVRLDRLNAGAPLLNSHDSSTLSSVLGSVVPGTATMVNGQGVARIKLSARPEVAGLVSDIRAGVIKNVSVGYRYHKVERDNTGDIPVWRVTDWEPLEVSAVAVGADGNAQFRAGVAYDVEVRG